MPTWFQGRTTIARVLATRIFTPARQMWLRPTQANGSPAFGLYQRTSGAEVYQFMGLFVLGVVEGQVGSLIAFLDQASLIGFAFPLTLPEASPTS